MPRSSREVPLLRNGVIMRDKTYWIASALIVATIACAGAGFFGLQSWVDRLRVRDATPAFEPLTPLNCEILSQPIAFRRHCRYLIEFSSDSSLDDSNAMTLECLNHLPVGNELDVVISTAQVTDAAIPALLLVGSIDILDVTRSGISDAGIERLQQGLSHTEVLKRKSH